MLLLYKALIILCSEIQIVLSDSINSQRITYLHSNVIVVI